MSIFSGLDTGENMALLKRRLHHDFVEEAAWYSLTEKAERVDGLLRSQDFYDRIWSGRPTRAVEETMEIEGETVVVSRLGRDAEMYRELVELLHKANAVPEDWYGRYIRHCEENKLQFDRTLEELMKQKNKDKSGTAAQAAVEALIEEDRHGQIP